MSDPSLSVVIPVYNAARYLGEAIESVLRERQDGLELIVVDDGSTDGSTDVARRYPGVRCHVQARAGPGGARNTGIGVARADILAFIDADDRWIEGKLERQLRVLRESPQTEAVFGEVACFVSPDLPPELAARVQLPPAPIAGPHVGTMVIRREAFARVGLFQTGRRVGEFVEWYARAIHVALVTVMLPEILLERRIHATNSARVRGDIGVEYVRVIKGALDRRRRLARS